MIVLPLPLDVVCCFLFGGVDMCCVLLLMCDVGVVCCWLLLL